MGTKLSKAILFGGMLLLSKISSAQSGISCVNAQPYNVSYTAASPSSVHTVTGYQNYWYSFIGGAKNEVITLKNNTLSPQATSIKVFFGPCFFQTMVGSDAVSSPSDSTLQVTLTNIHLNQTYYIEVIGNNISDDKIDYTLSVMYADNCEHGYVAPTCTNVINPANPCELALNGDFEQHGTSYPTGFSQVPSSQYIDLACTHFNLGDFSANYTGDGTPDYFIKNPNDYTSNGEYVGFESGTNCSVETEVPCNTVTYSWGHDNVNTPPNNAATYHGSNAYAGFLVEHSVTTVTTTAPPSPSGPQATTSTITHLFSEYIGTTLAAPLVCGVTYKCSYWIQLADYSQLSINNIGMMFSSVNTLSPNIYPTAAGGYDAGSTFYTYNSSSTNTFLAALVSIDNTPTTSAVVINNRGTWRQLTFSYTAQGGEQYMYIGNFLATDPSTTFQAIAPVTNPTINPGDHFWTDINFPTIQSLPCNISSESTGALTNDAYYIVDDISIQPDHSPLSISTNTAICSPNPDVLNLAGGFNIASNCGNSSQAYTWNTGQTGTPITVYPMGMPTTGYTVTNSISVQPGCTYSTSVTVSVSPTPTCPVISGNLCSGQSATLTISNADPSIYYSWSPTVMPVFGNSNNSQVIIPNPVAGTVYTVSAVYIACAGLPRPFETVNTHSCCTCSSTITVGAIPTVSINENPNPAIFCPSDPGSGVILTPSSNAYTYNWSPSIGLSCTSCSNPKATPPIPTNYTLTSTDPATGCTYSTSVLVTPTCTCGSATSPVYLGPTSIPASTNPILPNSSYSFNSNISFTGSGVVTLSNKTLYFAPNVSITVGTGVTLVLDHCHLLSCSDMWQGIIVQPGASLNVKNNSMIEDAIEAINCTNWFQPAAGVNNLTVNGCVFNRNKTGIRINNFLYTSNFPATIEDAVFTSRTLPATQLTNNWTSPATPAALKMVVSVPSGLQAPYALANTAAYTIATLKAPNQTIYGAYGVYLSNVGISNTNGTSTLPSAYNDITIGVQTTLFNSTALNLFDGLYYGVFANTSNFTCINNSFELLHSYLFIGTTCLKCPPPVNPYPSAGTAIYGTNTAVSPSNFVYTRGQVIYPGYAPATNPNTNNTAYFTPANNNKFFDCVTGVNTINYQEVHVAGTDIRSTQHTNPPISVVPLPGSYGILVTSVDYKYNYFRYNLITNINNGIIFTANTVATAAGSTQGLGLVSANYNTITANVSGNSPTTQYVTNAIAIDNSINCFSSNCHRNPYFSVSANKNTLLYVYRGIEMMNWIGGHYGVNKTVYNITADTNYISLTQNTQIVNATQFGVNTNHCFTHEVNLNNILGTNYAYASNTNMRGVYPKDNASSTVYCNHVTSVGRGFDFEGQNPGTFNNSDLTTWANNSMQNNGNGFRLTNACILGAQGSSSYASDNQWNGSWSGTNYGTYVDAASNAANSPLYVQNTSPYSPPNNGYVIQLNSYAQPGNVLSATASGNVCGALPQAPCTRCPIISGRTLAEQVVLDSLFFPLLAAENSYKAQLKYFRLISMNDTLIDSSVVLQNFFTINQTTNLGVINSIESSLAQGDVTTAKSLNTSLAPGNVIENNYQKFYTSAINVADTVYSVTDSLTLITLANSCPATNGDVVYSARALYNAVNNQYQYFEDNCNYDSLYQTTSARKSKKENSGFTSISKINSTLLVYPNPSTGDVYISSNDLSDKDWKLIVTDVTGRTVIENNYAVNNSLVKLSTQLTNGVYFIKVIMPDGTTKQQKVIITK